MFFTEICETSLSSFFFKQANPTPEVTLFVLFYFKVGFFFFESAQKLWQIKPNGSQQLQADCYHFVLFIPFPL